MRPTPHVQSLRTMRTGHMGELPEAQDGWILEGSQVKPGGQTDQITEGPDQKHTEGFKLLPKSSNKL